MTKYEAMFITRPELKEEEKEAIFKQLQDAIVKNGGQIITQQVWLAKSRLAFPIKRQKDGLYYLVQFSALTEAIQKLKHSFRLNESVLRFMITRIGS